MNNETGLASKLSDEQLRNFVMQLAPEDRSLVIERLASCSKEKLFTRCIPLAALVSGGLYLARDSLAKVLNRKVGPPLYIFAAVATVAVVNYNALRGECKNRSFSVLDELMKKYNYIPNAEPARENIFLQKPVNASDGKALQAARRTPEYQSYSTAEGESLSYSDLRRRNRNIVAPYGRNSPQQQNSAVAAEQSDSLEGLMAQQPQSKRVEVWTDNNAVSQDLDQKKYPQSKDYSVQVPAPVDDVPLLSGTPVGKRTTSYGDEGFS